MAAIGLINNIYEAATKIDLGRKGIATRGKAEEGRILFEDGIAEAIKTFKEAQATADPHTIIFAEYTFLSQEKEFCVEIDKEALSSLATAIQGFDDAFLALKVQGTLYIQHPKNMTNIIKNLLPVLVFRKFRYNTFYRRIL